MQGRLAKPIICSHAKLLGKQLLLIHSPEQGPLGAHHLPCSRSGNAQQSVTMQDTAAISVTIGAMRAGLLAEQGGGKGLLAAPALSARGHMWRLSSNPLVQLANADHPGCPG